VKDVYYRHFRDVQRSVYVTCDTSGVECSFSVATQFNCLRSVH